ncbi:hypothetical protein EV363DRAFT_1296775 [Boletus edulis]|nr:hypothetical protein EV363DRAFT_1296775 [Boletus edulis]
MGDAIQDTTIPQLSPSLTSSVTSMDSASLSSPGDIEPFLRPDSKSLLHDIDAHSTLHPNPPPTTLSRGPPPPSFKHALTLEDTQRAKDFFVNTLKHVPRGILQNTYAFKLADRECIAHRVALSMAELKSTEHRKNLLVSMGEYRKCDFEVNEAELQVLKTLLDTKGLTEADVAGDEVLQQETCQMELVELAATDQEVAHFQDAVTWRERGGWYTPSAFELNHRDNDSIYSDDSSDDGGDDGEPASQCSELHHEASSLHV